MTPWETLWEGSEKDASRAAAEAMARAGFTEDDVEDLVSRFLPSGCFPQFSELEVWILLCLVADDVLSMERYAPYTPTPLVSQIAIPRKIGRETSTHRDLKQRATEWLGLTHGVTHFLYEEPYEAGVSDLMSADRRWIVECGGSRPSKLLEFYLQKSGEPQSRSKVKVCFFNNHGVTVFGAGERLGDYLAMKSQS